MNKETMTVHMALAEMKTIEKRIGKAIENFVPVATKEVSAAKVNGIEIDKFNDNAKASRDKVLNLIARQNAMKTAIYQYNTSTNVTIAGNSMTVAQALWMMQYGMAQKRALLTQYEKAYTKAQKEIDKANGEELNRAAERAADVIVSSKDASKSTEYMDAVEDYKKRHEKLLIDPLDIKTEIEKLSDEIAKFEAEADARIQTANATNSITIEY